MEWKFKIFHPSLLETIFEGLKTITDPWKCKLEIIKHISTWAWKKPIYVMPWSWGLVHPTYSSTPSDLIHTTNLKPRGSLANNIGLTFSHRAWPWKHANLQLYLYNAKWKKVYLTSFNYYTNPIYLFHFLYSSNFWNHPI